MEPAARSARSGSDSETLATFRAAPGEDLTTGSRRHAGAKTVSTLTMQVAGLVGTLHCWLSLLSSDFLGDGQPRKLRQNKHMPGRKEGRQGYAATPAVSSEKHVLIVREIARSGCG
jgi:hypothetical protein